MMSVAVAMSWLAIWLLGVAFGRATREHIAVTGWPVEREPLVVPEAYAVPARTRRGLNMQKGRF